MEVEAAAGPVEKSPVTAAAAAAAAQKAAFPGSINRPHGDLTTISSQDFGQTLEEQTAYACDLLSWCFISSPPLS